MILFRDEIRKDIPDYLLASQQFRDFLNKREPKLVRLLTRRQGNPSDVITYADLRDAVENGDLSEETMQKLRDEYAKWVTTRLLPAWDDAIKASQETMRKKHYQDWYYDPFETASDEWMQKRSAALVVDISEQQRNALRAVIRRAVLIEHQTADSLAQVIRPMVGLYPQQMTANMNYYLSVLKKLQEANPNASIEDMEAKARHMAQMYAEKQHRYRAQMIARTELSKAYNNGELISVQQAVKDGMMLPTTKKKWVTARDDRVCKYCEALDKVTINLTDEFQGRKQSVQCPPMHPHCRCVLIYVEEQNE
jgi:SPP1 gp7 family putative phage head morphogenesis protein